MQDNREIPDNNKQPNSRTCFVCGVANAYGLQLRFYNSAPGEVTAEYTVPSYYQGYPRVVHGGIVAAMLDEVCGRALMQEDPPRFMVTARLEVRYRKNVPVGEPLRLVGQALRRKGRSASAKGQLFSQDGALLAEADAILVELPQDALEAVDLTALGWKVYPD